METFKNKYTTGGHEHIQIMKMQRLQLSSNNKNGMLGIEKCFSSDCGYGNHLGGELIVVAMFSEMLKQFRNTTQPIRIHEFRELDNISNGLYKPRAS